MKQLWMCVNESKQQTEISEWICWHRASRAAASWRGSCCVSAASQVSPAVCRLQQHLLLRSVSAPDRPRVSDRLSVSTNWPSQTFCLSGWFVSTCCPRQYHYVDDPKTWTEAQSYCTQTHTDLASTKNTEEMKQLNSTVSPAARSSELWIGLYSQISWRWSDGFTGSGADYRNWDTSEYEPDFYSGVQFCVSSLKGKWWDYNCREKLQFICYRGRKKPTFDFKLLNFNLWFQCTITKKKFHSKKWIMFN